jgi:hemoglobin
MPDTTIFEALGGAERVQQLAHAWHEQVMAEEIVSHAFSHGFHPQHTERLAAYWGEAWGGPPAYSEQGGNESSVVRMHSGNGAHEEMDRRAIACFDRAMDDAGLSDPLLWRVLHDYFAWATSSSMAAYPEDANDVPEGLQVPRWSWNGLQAP